MNSNKVEPKPVKVDARIALDAGLILLGGRKELLDKTVVFSKAVLEAWGLGR